MHCCTKKKETNKQRKTEKEVKKKRKKSTKRDLLLKENECVLWISNTQGPPAPQLCIFWSCSKFQTYLYFSSLLSKNNEIQTPLLNGGVPPPHTHTIISGNAQHGMPGRMRSSIKNQFCF